MSGHSKWAQIKRQKGVADARKGQIFTRLGRELTIAAREGGGDPASNFRLRLAIQRAKDHNMPTDNIERAIKRGTGELEAETLEEVIYEGYGPGGTAVLLEVLTNNRNRTVAEVRNIFTRLGGSLGESGCVVWLFEQKGVITIPAHPEEREELALHAIDAGADDVKLEDGYVEIFTQPHDLEAVRRVLEGNKVTVQSAEISMIPKTTVELDEKTALQTMKLLEKLEDLEEVQRVYSNAEFPNTIIEKYQG